MESSHTSHAPSLCLTGQSDGATVQTPSKTSFVTERRRPVSLTMTVFVVVAHLQDVKRTTEGAAFGD